MAEGFLKHAFWLYPRKGSGVNSHVLKVAIDRLHEMPSPVGVETYNSLLHCCKLGRNVKECKRIHAHIRKSQLNPPRKLKELLVHLYGHCGRVLYARKVFASIPSPTMGSWAIFMNALSRNGRFMTVMRYQRRLFQKGVKFDDILTQVLVHACLRCGNVEDARCLLFRMPGPPDSRSWGQLLTAYVDKGKYKEALSLFNTMQQYRIKVKRAALISVLDACAVTENYRKGKIVHRLILTKEFRSDLCVNTAALNMYLKCGRLELARSKVFNRMNKTTAAIWTCMISEYVKVGEFREAVKLFHLMDQQGVRPDESTFVAFVGAFASIEDVTEAKAVHARIVECGFHSCCKQLVNFYAKYSSLTEAGRVLNEVEEYRLTEDVWVAMMTAYSDNGHFAEATECMQKMTHLGIKCEANVFQILLSAACICVDNAWKQLRIMIQEFAIQPREEHYKCMLNILLRSGEVEEGEDLINCTSLRDDRRAWINLMTATNLHGDKERARRIGKLVFRMEHTPYLLLSKMYVRAGMLDHVAKLNQSMKRMGLETLSVSHDFSNQQEEEDLKQLAIAFGLLS